MNRDKFTRDVKPMIEELHAEGCTAIICIRTPDGDMGFTACGKKAEMLALSGSIMEKLLREGFDEHQQLELAHILAETLIKQFQQNDSDEFTSSNAAKLMLQSLTKSAKFH